MLMALGQDEMAQRLTTSVYEYASDMVLQDREAGVGSSDLNLFLLQKSNELLREWRKSDAASTLGK